MITASGKSLMESPKEDRKVDQRSEDVSVFLFVILGVLIIGGLFVFTVIRDRNAFDAFDEQKCTEDMECWDCETMGNKICGPKIGGSND